MTPSSPEPGIERSKRVGGAVQGNRVGVLLLLFLSTIPAWALLTYPGWLELAAGYFPYFNLNAWSNSPTLLWSPPYTLFPGVPALAWPEMLAFLLNAWGLGPLAALRAVIILALLVGTWGIYRWQRRCRGTWAALAAALLWLYAPATLYTAYRLGFIGTLWVAAAVAWFLGWLAPSPLSARWSWIFGLSALVAWGVRLLLPPTTWGWWLLVLGSTLAAVPAVGRVFDRRPLSGPLPLLLATALAAVLVVPWARPHYVGYTPRPQPVAIFGEQDIVLLEAKRNGALEPGKTIQVQAWWQVIHPQKTDWTVFVQVLDDQNTLWGQFDGPLGGEKHPTSRWRPGEVGRETYTLTVAEGAPAHLRLIMGLYDHRTLKRLSTGTGRDHVVIR